MDRPTFVEHLRRWADQHCSQSRFYADLRPYPSESYEFGAPIRAYVRPHELDIERSFTVFIRLFKFTIKAKTPNEKDSLNQDGYTLEIKIDGWWHDARDWIKIMGNGQVSCLRWTNRWEKLRSSVPEWTMVLDDGIVLVKPFPILKLPEELFSNVIELALEKDTDGLVSWLGVRADLYPFEFTMLRQSTMHQPVRPKFNVHLLTVNKRFCNAARSQIYSQTHFRLENRAYNRLSLGRIIGETNVSFLRSLRITLKVPAWFVHNASILSNELVASLSGLKSLEVRARHPSRDHHRDQGFWDTIWAIAAKGLFSRGVPLARVRVLNPVVCFYEGHEGQVVRETDYPSFGPGQLEEIQHMPLDEFVRLYSLHPFRDLGDREYMTGYWDHFRDWHRTTNFLLGFTYRALPWL